ncbi:Helicase [Lasiodiplodia theobromae]|uniref:Helicase n=1 Tax=Lasiodiplodia theobromae TaxID=45133 RepID=A0A5N5D717_9PEZI|nr:putative ATP-dependent RNA helicase [Lasiodiplodia theobromae]KAF9629339.1 Helicase [Lasiodiplodia theobromae]
MPKNPHPPRGGGGSKKSAPPPSGAEDTSYIVFSNSKGDSKKGKKADNAAKNDTNDKGKVKTKGAPEQPEDAPKKPDVRTIIGGASWTGKLPVNMLSEHCQKQKWEKPEYTMNKVKNGFVSHVILKATNPKTRETTTLPPIRLPTEKQDLALQPTALEARHFAATYTLFRVASMKNIHMMMPPTYKDLWKGAFTDMKKEDVKSGKGWMYEADPFVAQKEREQAKVEAEKKREEVAKQREKEKSQSTGIGAQSSGGSNIMRGWTRVPKLDMGKRIRAEIERLIRRDAVWNPHSVKISPAERSVLIDEVVKLGFRKSHVEEAAEVCKDREEILEWLLIHVPEDDLPPWSLPEGYTAGISMASGNLKREAAVKRLAATGYAVELCEEALDTFDGDEAKAAGLLQARLLGDDELAEQLSGATIADESGWDEDVWAEEQIILASIYDEKYSTAGPDQCQIRLEIADGTKTEFLLNARRPAGLYPNILPIISINAKIPAYIRLSIIRQALSHAKENFLGEQMIFNIVDWLEHEIPSIIDNPGRLTDVSSAISAADTGVHAEAIKQKEKRQRRPKPVNLRPGSQASQRALEQWQAKQTSPEQQRMLRARQNLPAWKLQQDIVDAVKKYQVVIISGETGSGKSTQSVQFILDDMIQRQLGEAVNIVCTQPRRISALGLADRVADERCTAVGDEVGYSIRGESRQKPGVTKLTFMTTGVLLRRLQTSGGRPEDVVASLADITHVVVDEVHERSLDTDFLLVLLRDVLKKRKDLRVILMSATLDADVFASFFKPAVGQVGMVEIAGRTHPVTDYYVDDVIRMSGFNGHTADEDWEDEETQKSIGGTLRSIGMRINYDLIAQTVQYIDMELGSQDGAILIFLPGTMEIDRTIQALRSMPNLHALPLHASLLPAEQRRVFPPPPKGKRKVIASTNVAETSITIEDVVAVIDTGRVKETSFDPANNMVKLAETWASRAACKQRRGRAGRVRAGTCYKLYTRNVEKDKMMERPDPEIRRVPLEQLCLSVKAMGVKDVAGFLAGALTPPDSVAVEGALELLGRMGAIDGDEMTALGRHLAVVPADLRCAKLMVYGATFGCLEPCLVIASILTVRSPFVSPQAKREESKAARSAFGKGQGDLIADLRAYEHWAGLKEKGISPRDLRAWCEQNFLSTQTLNDITSTRRQYLSSLQETGFIPLRYSSYSDSAAQVVASLNRHSANDSLIRALVAGSFNPQLARIDFPDKKFAASVSGAVELDPEAKTIKYFNQENGRVFVHPSSTLFDAQGFPGGAAFMSYFTKMATSKVFIRDLTPFNAYSLLLFSGPITLDTMGRGVVVDGWLRLRGWARIGVLVSRLRMMLDDALASKIDDPTTDLAGSDVVGIVRKLVELDGLDR